MKCLQMNSKLYKNSNIASEFVHRDSRGELCIPVLSMDHFDPSIK